MLCLNLIMFMVRRKGRKMVSRVRDHSLSDTQKTVVVVLGKIGLLRANTTTPLKKTPQPDIDSTSKSTYGLNEAVSAQSLKETRKKTTTYHLI